MPFEDLKENASGMAYRMIIKNIDII